MSHPGLVQNVGNLCKWTQTICASHNMAVLSYQSTPPTDAVRTPERVMATNGDWCGIGSWVLWTPNTPDTRDISKPCLGKILEIIQLRGSRAEFRGLADWVLIRRASVGAPHGIYHMPHVSVLDEYDLVDPRVSHLYRCISSCSANG